MCGEFFIDKIVLCFIVLKRHIIHLRTSWISANLQRQAVVFFSFSVQKFMIVFLLTQVKKIEIRSNYKKTW